MNELEAKILEILKEPASRAEIYYHLYHSSLHLEFFKGTFLHLFCPAAQSALTKLMNEQVIYLNRANEMFVFQNLSKSSSREDFNLKAFRELKLGRIPVDARIPRLRG